MTDVLTQVQRRRNMAAIRGKDTGPERTIRRLVHSMGYRYLLHDRRLPGRPDLVFPRRRKVIFVHGCFWHMHECKYGRVVPATNAEFWHIKRTANVERDVRSAKALSAQGWDVLVTWECEIRDLQALTQRLIAFLEPRQTAARHRRSRRRTGRKSSNY
jgi:DNA mismatch endonuclease, patch repair protein